MGSTLLAGLAIVAVGTGNFGFSPPDAGSFQASVVPSVNVCVVGNANESASGSGPA